MPPGKRPGPPPRAMLCLNRGKRLRLNAGRMFSKMAITQGEVDPGGRTFDRLTNSPPSVHTPSRKMFLRQ